MAGFVFPEVMRSLSSEENWQNPASESMDEVLADLQEQDSKKSEVVEEAEKSQHAEDSIQKNEPNNIK